VPKIQINPQTQIRWNNDAVPSGYDIPIDAMPAHHTTHEYGGSDEVLIQTSQVQGLDAQLAAIGNYTHSDENETITGQWTFTQDTYFPSGITANILSVEVVQFQAIPRPTDLVIGDVYRDQVDNKLYMQTSTGTRAFLFMDFPAPAIPRLQLAHALGYVAGTFKVAIGQARAYLLRVGSAQAQAQIKAIRTNKHGQANARIEQIISKHAQSRAKIAGIRVEVGQAMADINNHTRVAQATAQILQPNFPKQGYASVDAKIRSTEKQSAQATAWIE
jgi:hypothetical protein